MNNLFTITQELNKCINCKKPACVDACPINNNIPSIVNALKIGDSTLASNLLSKSVLSDVCARVCYGYCMEACNMAKLGKGPNIRGIEKFIFDNYSFNIPSNITPNGKTTAVIGSGPSGLAYAYHMAINGYKVTVYEKEEYLGGLLRYAIPFFILDEDTIDKCISRLKNVGVEFKTNCFVDANKLSELTKSYDYIYLALGANKQVIPQIQNIMSSSSLDSNTFLLEFNKSKNFALYEGKNIIVLGGGNVAMDVAKCAKFAKAKNVTICYRRTICDMPAKLSEINEVLSEKIKILELSNPVSLNYEGSALKTITCEKMISGPIGEDGRNTFIKTGEYFDIDADLFIYAAGSYPDNSDYNSILDNNRGKIIINSSSQTSLSNIYAGGDLVRGPSSVTIAIADGINAAKSIINE